MRDQMKRTSIEQLLMESFKELAEKRPFDKITIKEITDQAGVIRPTFYNHFQDKYELIERIIEQDLLDPMRMLIRNNLVQEAMLLLFTGIEKNREFYSRMVKMEGAVSFEELACRCAREMILDSIRSQMPEKGKISWLTPERLAGYYAQSMIYVMSEWIKSGMSVPAREVSEIYNYILTRSMDEVVREMQ